MWGETLTCLLIGYAFVLGWLFGRKTAPAGPPVITVAPVFNMADQVIPLPDQPAGGQPGPGPDEDEDDPDGWKKLSP